MARNYSGLDDGYGSPFIKLYHEDRELTTMVSQFEYTYDEDGDDVCKFEIRAEDRNEPDKPYWQEKSKLKVIWGFLGSRGFIQGDISPTRTIYIQQIAWEFNTDGVSAKIDATEKAVSLKYSDSQEVHQNISLVGLAHKLAEKAGLNAIIQTDGEEPLEFLIKPQNGDFLSPFLKDNRKAINKRDITNVSKEDIDKMAKQYTINQELVDHIDGNRPATNYHNEKIAKMLESPEIQEDVRKQHRLAMADLNPEEFRKYTQIPQANRTDKQLLDQYAQREGYSVDTRDDDLIIKKRNFKQLPYKSYTYGGDEGSLTEFSPMTKIRHHAKGSNNVGFQNWNPLDKTAMTGNANGLSDNNPTLSEYRKQFRFYSAIAKHGGGNLVMDNLRGNMQSTLFNPNSKNAIDQFTAPFEDKIFNKRITVDQKLDALKKSLIKYQNIVENSTYDAMAHDPVNAFNASDALRKSKELKMNPANATIYGDPSLRSGILLTILGISKKYSGNYYVTKATHKLGGGSAYLVTCELVTQGTNLKTTQDDVRTTGKVNKQIGPDKGNKHHKVINTKSNP